MIFVCPNPTPWYDAWQRCREVWLAQGCVGEEPPAPLILNGWVYSSDSDKKRRWDQLVLWANEHGIDHLLPSDPAVDAYFTAQLSTTYAEQRFGKQIHERAVRPEPEELEQAVKNLQSQWEAVAGPDLYETCTPIGFSGKKARKLLVKVAEAACPPWGGWAYLAPGPERKTFTAFRKRVNDCIAPHQVDHVDFITG